MLQRQLNGLDELANARAVLLDICQQVIPARPRPVDKPLWLYGAGNLGKMAHAYLQWLGIPVCGVVDRRADFWREQAEWRDIPLLLPEELDSAQKQDLLAVTISTLPYSRLQAELQAQGWTDIQPFYDVAEAYRHRHPLSNGWFAGSLSEDEVSGMQHTLALWEDSCSRAHYLQFLAWRCLRQDWVDPLYPVAVEQRYFIPEVRACWQEQECWLDVGAHHGEVSLRIVAERAGHTDRFILIEADAANAQVIRQQAPDFTLLPCCVGERAARQPFLSGQGYASQPTPLSDEFVEQVTLDSLGLAPTVIKLHLEGHELAALRGSVQTLQAQRPLLMITAYHNRDGMAALPLWLAAHLPDYRFLFRLHGWCGTAALIYGIPIERESLSRA
ncbi:SAM-dependent methyltransferase [Aquitalea magnusonii]|uniref:SAM-dependent methyltransferase n=1 Tax=Aquitalea magnusonii TaxID=332411 RepID=A0A3G9GJP0_9NEIS|nr:FkbM family methyltransferase [Aquitalea magnusonii]BBF88108.1 SAM-dependent methyltransferase [Aquitalea magnusonii]